jgi:proteic killer suppression protein
MWYEKIYFRCAFESQQHGRMVSIMIVSFADQRTENLYLTGKSNKIPPDVIRRTLRKLTLLDAASGIDDLRYPPGNRLHQLEGDRDGQYSISVNDQWRICFNFIGNDAYAVELCDYH